MFCAGADLRERKTMSETQVALFLDSLRAMLSELEALSIPTVAVVDGFALGGGTELALGCDLRVGGKGPTRHALSSADGQDWAPSSRCRRRSWASSLALGVLNASRTWLGRQRPRS